MADAGNRPVPFGGRGKDLLCPYPYGKKKEPVPEGRCDHVFAR